MKNNFEVGDLLYVVDHAEEFSPEFRNGLFTIIAIEPHKIWFSWNGKNRYFNEPQFNEVINFKSQKPNGKLLRLIIC